MNEQQNEDVAEVIKAAERFLVMSTVERLVVAAREVAELPDAHRVKALHLGSVKVQFTYTDDTERVTPADE